MTTLAGTRLGGFEITAKLGEGGMGEVWRATDSRLKREVAIKVLPAAFTADPERLARFEREAQLLAHLQHPNIAAIFGLEEQDGIRALVMELVEGPTLEERLAHGALPVEECVAIARQIAEALEEAHEKGIVHRDLKPANVKVTLDGRVKVLDFGLAKAMEPTVSASASSPADLARSPTLMNSPTLTAIGGTQLGVILGTAAYMAPEQARGGIVDKRADVWAFGVILYEMLTDRRLFAAETVSDTLAAVLRAEIDLAPLPGDTPAAVRALLRRCLERNPKLRLRDIGEARVALDPASIAHAEPATPAPAVPPARSRAGRLLPWTLVALLAIVLGLVVARGGSPSHAATPARPRVLAVRLPGSATLSLENFGVYGQTGVLAVSPDASSIAFVQGGIGRSALVVREMETGEVRVLDGTAGASSPFFSPDGRWLAYFAPGKLRKIAVDGGQPIDVADANLNRGGVWCPDGTIVFAAGATEGLSRVDASGGPVRALTRVDDARGERTHRWPALVPGGREVAFTVGVAGRPGDYDDSQIEAVDLQTGKRRPFLRGGSMVRFTADGLALVARHGQLLAIRAADAHGQSVEDAPVALRNVAGIPASGIAHFGVADDGTLVYAEGDPQVDGLELDWLQRNGELQPLAIDKGQYGELRLSPDGRRVAIGAGPGGGRGGDILVHDLASGGLTRLTTDGHSQSPAWSRDGKRVAFVTWLATGGEDLRARVVDGGEPAETLAHFADAKARGPVGWLADGSLLYWQDSGAGRAGDLLILPVGGGAPRPFVATPAIEIQPAISPDGRYVAYVVDSAGRQDVFVQPYPPTGAIWEATEGAGAPVWSFDGKELFFVRSTGLFALPLSIAGSGFSTLAPRKLLDLPRGATLAHDTDTTYAMAPDGRFLIARSTAAEPTNDHLVVVVDWLARLHEILAKKP